VAVIGITCVSDFGTSNKIGFEEGVWLVVLILCPEWTPCGKFGEKKIICKAPVGRTHKECRRVILVPSI